MARNPAALTRGTISGRPANATVCPRSVNTRAIPRLGGRLPPPDQFNHSILAMSFLRACYAIDHLTNDRLGGSSAQLSVAPQDLPDIDIGEDSQDFEKLGPRAAADAFKLRRERGPYPVTVVFSSFIQARL